VRCGGERGEKDRGLCRKHYRALSAFRTYDSCSCLQTTAVILVRTAPTPRHRHWASYPISKATASTIGTVQYFDFNSHPTGSWPSHALARKARSHHQSKTDSAHHEHCSSSQNTSIVNNLLTRRRNISLRRPLPPSHIYPHTHNALSHASS
jgi:hypothetical protein